MPTQSLETKAEPQLKADRHDPRQWRTRDYLWRGALIAFTLFVIFTSIITFWFYVQYAHYSRELKQTVEQIRAAGGPLEAHEIEAYYRVPDGVDDLTEEYMQALAIFLQRERTPVQQTPEEQQLPHVGLLGAAKFGKLVGEDFDLRPAAEKYLSPFQPSLDQLRALANKQGRCRYPVKMADNIAALLPYTQVTRDAARHLQLDFDLQLASGNREQALADLLALLRVGEMLSEEPILISQLVRAAIFGMFLKASEEFLADGKASETELVALNAALKDVDFQRGLQRALNGERAMGYLALKSHNAQQMAAMAGNGGSTKYVPPISNLKDLRPGDTAALLQLETEMLEAAQADFPQALENMKRVDDKVKKMAGETKLPWNKNILATMLMPAMVSVGTATARSLAAQRSLEAAIAMERCFAKSGERPAALADLVPEYLPYVAIDPYGGGPMQLKMQSDGYTIYSVGKDKVDNGGILDDQQTDVGVQIRTATPE